MKRKFIFIIFLMLEILLTSCKNNEEQQIDKHYHDISLEWDYDEKMHWNVCSCGDIINKFNHTYVNGICAICDYVKSPLLYNLLDDDAYEVYVEKNSYSEIIIPNTFKGIVNTHFDKTYFENIKNYSLGFFDDFSIEWTNEFSTYCKKGFHNLFFVGPNYANQSDEYAYIMMKYDKEILEEYNLINTVLEGDDYIFCDYYSQILKHRSTQNQRFGGIMLTISIVVILFAVILFANFITVSIHDKIRQIGVLRAIGATKRQISTIFIVQNSIVGIAVFIFSCFMIKYAIMPVLLLLGATEKLPFPWFELVAYDYLILFGIILFTTIISSIIPLLRLSKKTPRDLMIK